MLFGNNSNQEISLYYLYMMADGEVSSNEKKIFNNICKELNIDNDTKNSVIKECNGIVDDTKNILNIIVREKFDEQLGQGWFGLGSGNASNLSRIVWNLVNLGFADSDFSNEEKEIVNYFIDKWSINLEVYRELVDTAETILALTKQKEWIASTFSEESIRNKRKRSIDKTIKQLIDDVKLTIEELTI